jgi:hypothetical protein
MNSRLICRAFSPFVLGLPFFFPFALAEQARRVRIHTDFTEADAALAILDKRSASEPLTDADWQALFSTEPYERLKKRSNPFTLPPPALPLRQLP